MKLYTWKWYQIIGTSKNEYNLQSDYESRDEYLEDHDIKVDRKGKIE